nr:tetratricopeptide repeat protein 28-like [Pocillopora verrucosa]
MAEKKSDLLEQRKQDLVNAKLDGDARKEMFAYKNLGEACMKVDDTKRAIDNFIHSLRIAQQERDRAYEGKVSCDLGDAYYELEDYKQATTHFNKCLIIYKELSDRAGEKNANHHLGHCYMCTANYKEAIAHFNKFLIISEELGDRDGETGAHCCLSRCYSTLSDHKQAVEHLIKCLIICKEIGDRDREGIANYGLGKCYQALSDYKQAIEHFNKCLIIYKELSDRVREKNANRDLGHCYMRTANYKEAIVHFNKFLIISEELGDRDGETCVHRCLSRCYSTLSDHKQAVEHLIKCLIICKEIGDRDEEGFINYNIGKCYQALGDYKQAVNHFNKCLIICKERADREGEESANHQLGHCYHAISDHEQAIEHFNKYRIISKELGDREEEQLANYTLASCYYTLKDYEQAIQYIEQSLIIAKNNGNRDMEGKGKQHFGLIYAVLGDYEKATEYYKQKLDIAIGAGDRDGELDAYGRLGSVYNNLGKFSKAKEYHDIQLAIAKELKNKDAEANSYFGLGRAYLQRGDFMKAIEFFCQLLNIAERKELIENEGCAYTRLCEAYLALHNFKEAANCGMKGLAIAKEKGHKGCEIGAHHILGLTMECLNFLHEALDHYRSALKILNDERDIIKAEDAHKICFRNSRQLKYDAVCRTLLKLSNFGEALCVVDQGRAQVLLDYMKQKYQMEFPPPRTSEPDVAPLVSTQTIFISLEEEKINIWLVSNGNDVQFRQKEAKHDYKFGNDPCPCCLKCLKKSAFKENEFAARVICEDRSMDALMPNLWEQDEDSCHEMSALLSEDSFRLDVQRNSLRLLYDAVIGPIANELKGDELLIIPDGLLGLVPFAAFVDKDSKYLSETFKIRIAPSLTTLKLINDCPENYHCKSGALLVGNPCFEEITDLLGIPWFQPLPHAEKEVQMIGKIINATPLVGKEATKDEVLKRIASVALVHIATHGSAETGDICLAPNPSRKYRKPEKKDYMLKMSDIKALKLRARLVVLSSCHSGRGNVSAEGVVGIAWALLASGARSVLASLWAIGDEATMEFMKTFYEHLRDGNNASTALNKAMKCLRESEKFSAPKNWAPFVLIGDDVTFEFEEDIEQC